MKRTGMTMTIFAAVTLVALALAACSATTPAARGAAGGPIKIGGAFALTGEESSLDRPAADGARLAVKEINAAGGLLGRPIDLVTRDTRYRMDVTAQVARQLVEQDKVGAVIGFTDTDSVLAAGPVIQRAGLPFVTPGATSPKIPSQIGDTIFLACFGDNVQAAAGAEFAAKRFGQTAALLLNGDVEYTTLLAAYFKTRFTELGGVIVLEDRYADKTTDFTAPIAKLKALPRPPNFYYVAAMPYDVFFTTDAMHLLGAAIRGANTTDAAAVRKALEAIRNLSGVTLGAEIVPEKIPAP